jgi:hypothetical protein
VLQLNGEELEAIARLRGHQDFQVLIAALDREYDEVLTTLMSSAVTNVVHQNQGAAQVLMDILRAATPAQRAAS